MNRLSFENHFKQLKCFKFHNLSAINQTSSSVSFLAVLALF